MGITDEWQFKGKTNNIYCKCVRTTCIMPLQKPSQVSPGLKSGVCKSYRIWFKSLSYSLAFSEPSWPVAELSQSRKDHSHQDRNSIKVIDQTIGQGWFAESEVVPCKDTGSVSGYKLCQKIIKKWIVFPLICHLSVIWELTCIFPHQIWFQNTKRTKKSIIHFFLYCS